MKLSNELINNPNILKFFKKVNEKYSIPIATSKKMLKGIGEKKEETKNRGTGAGGKNTNVTGKRFESTTCAYNTLISDGFIKDEYLTKTIDDKKIIYTNQTEFKKYMRDTHNIKTFRVPDEAYIIENGDNITVKILEKKNQTGEGSVETKLWASSLLKREYQIHFGDKFKIEYALCVSDFLKKKITSNGDKYKILRQMLDEVGIDVLYGNDKNYFDKLKNWIYK
jgi:hypothetical protein